MTDFRIFVYYIIFSVVVACLGILTFHQISEAAKTPLVRFSYSDQRCVQVVNFADYDSFTCENLPTKYIHEWVE